MHPLPTVPEFVKDLSATKIVCTLGPASQSKEVIEKLIMSGMSVARINLAHGTLEEHRVKIGVLRRLEKDLGTHISVLTDLPGPKYRLGKIKGNKSELREGEQVTLSANENDALPYWPRGLERDVSEGVTVSVDDGNAELRVQKVTKDGFGAVVTKGGVIGSNKTLTAIRCSVSLEYVSSEATEFLEFSQEVEADFVGLSCVRNARDIPKVREFFKDGWQSRLIAKIERRQALDNLAEIVAQADGVMVARGDLGIELPLPEVPGAQKRIIEAANTAGKPVITATQMLESMLRSARPTRAEVTDIYNAVHDGSDAVMLSGETATGDYPVEAVRYMCEVARQAETLLDRHRIAVRRYNTIAEGHVTDEVIAYNAVQVARSVGAKAIVAFTTSGSTAVRLAAFRANMPLLVAYHKKRAAQMLPLLWGVTPVPFYTVPNLNELFYRASLIAERNGYARKGDPIVVVAGTPVGIKGATNLVRVVTVPEPRPTG